MQPPVITLSSDSESDDDVIFVPSPPETLTSVLESQFNFLFDVASPNAPESSNTAPKRSYEFSSSEDEPLAKREPELSNYSELKNLVRRGIHSLADITDDVLYNMYEVFYKERFNETDVIRMRYDAVDREYEYKKMAQEGVVPTIQTESKSELDIFYPHLMPSDVKSAFFDCLKLGRFPRGTRLIQKVFNAAKAEELATVRLLNDYELDMNQEKLEAEIRKIMGRQRVKESSSRDRSVLTGRENGLIIEINDIEEAEDGSFVFTYGWIPNTHKIQEKMLNLMIVGFDFNNKKEIIRMTELDGFSSVGTIKGASVGHRYKEVYVFLNGPDVKETPHTAKVCIDIRALVNKFTGHDGLGIGANFKIYHLTP